MTTHQEPTWLRVHYLRGPNVWTYRPVLEVWLDLGGLEQHPSDRIPGFVDRLLALLPGLVEHHCGVGERGGFLQRLQGGTWAGHVLEHVVIELLNLAGMPTGFGQTRSTSAPGVYRMVFRARDEQVAREALAQGRVLMMAAINDLPHDVAASVDHIRTRVDDCYLGPSTACIVAAATERRIPHLRLNGGNLVQIGHGAEQRRIWTAETDLTSAIAEGIARDKDLTKTLLKACGVPVPEGQVVDSPAAAWAAAQTLGLPVVVKPSDGNHGRGVTLELTTQADVEAAYAVAEPEGSEVIVERCIRGNEHRLLVVGGQVVAAARGEAAWVTGNGVSTVAQLVAAQLNTDPRRGEAEEAPLGLIEPDEDRVVQLELQRQGLAADAVPAAGRQVLVQRNGNVSIDCTDEVHPEVAHAATLAARVVGLDIAGIDLVTQDIGQPLQTQGGAIVEVNAGPGLLMHLKPAEGTPRPVGQAIVGHLFPPVDGVQAGRIPVVGVAGSNDNCTVARLVAWLLQLGGRHVGLACADGLFLDRRRIDARNSTDWEAGQRLLINRSVEAAVFENGPGAIARDGLPYDRCHVGIVTDLDALNHAGHDLARHDVHDVDQLARLLRTQVDVVLPEGAAVLNADDARVAALAPLSDGEVVFYGADPHLALLAQHRAEGGRAVFLRQGRMVLASGADEAVLSGRGLASFSPQLRMASLPAVAAAWVLGLSPDLIAAGLETFEPGSQAAISGFGRLSGTPAVAAG